MTRVSFSMDPFVQKFQPERFDDWVNKRDIAPHPMDPPEVVEGENVNHIFLFNNSVLTKVVKS